MRSLGSASTTKELGSFLAIILALIVGMTLLSGVAFAQTGDTDSRDGTTNDNGVNDDPGSIDNGNDTVEDDSLMDSATPDLPQTGATSDRTVSLALLGGSLVLLGTGFLVAHRKAL